MASLLSLSPLKPKASAAASPAPALDSLDLKFGRKGIKFSDSGLIPTVELTVRNGSSLKLDIPTALITSYKPKVYWKEDDSAFEEVLHTLPPSRGGVAVVVDDLTPQLTPKNAPKNVVKNSTEWIVKDVDSDSIDAVQVENEYRHPVIPISNDMNVYVQVELSCSRGCLDISYVVSLYPLSMAAAVIVKNTGKKPVDLAAAILTHFKLKKRWGSGVQGLKGCSYCTHPPLSSPFQLLSPAEATKAEDPGFFSFGWEPEKKPGEWSVQEAPITVLRHKLSRVYAAPVEQRIDPFHARAPSKYETIDQVSWLQKSLITFISFLFFF